jgi:cell division protein FtsI (penicillin-binding protein 3)
MDVKRDILWRVYLSYVLIIIVCIAIFGKALYIQQVQGTYWRSLSDSLHQRIISIPAERGTIYSEDGQMLSTNMPKFDILIDFRVDPLHDQNGKLFREKIDTLCDSLSYLFKDKTPQEYKQELTAAFEASVPNYEFKKKIDYDQFSKLFDFPLVKLGRYTSGFIAIEKNTRLNPYEKLGYRTIGLAREQNQVGLESSYDTVLRGQNGKQLVRAIAGGVTVPVQEGEYEVTPQTGKDIVTNIDVFIQEVTEKALHNMMVGNSAKQGVAMVMEVKTGKIKAIANLGRLENGSYSEIENYATQATEPGSTFKLVTLLAALENGVTLNSPINLEGGFWTYKGGDVKDAEPHGIHETNVLHAFEHSSNVGMAKLAVQYFVPKPEAYFKQLSKLRIDSLSGLDLTGEARSTIYKPGSSSWNAITLPWMAFGYTVRVAPIQTLTLYNAIANNGVMMRPYLVNAIKEEGRTIKSIQPKAYPWAIASPNSIKAARTALEGVCINGTGKDLFLKSLYKVAGKTGTSKVAEPNGVGYRNNIFQSSFVGYFPADNPQYTIAVIIINRPNAPNHYGASVAGPVWREIADRLYSTYIQNKMEVTPNFQLKDSQIYNYATSKISLKTIAKNLSLSYKDSSLNNDWVMLQGEKRDIKITPKPMKAGIMPNIIGMKLQDALWICENNGLMVKSVGKGKVMTQSIVEGQKIIRGQQIQIQLN